ncbi:relaxase/mobilization nuclease domain-containing protein [Dyadobacter psychrotolerans]|uniref:MobA/VirD2-like nuclease domain-containing protein n=1 Tax=Dyadobacter psychrotolerans TaxID=2541721 RepID=A0A4R5DJI1_9BACT|nr:relaxase/mobilization nuclease domain-containing protein [Dyadobacter psychrotolerans]TDE10733.1 hypothetical protein E0F88_27040 [Dyadobacter psychrotolerans]
MVVNIQRSARIDLALNYNERKVKDKKAKLIGGENFIKEAELLNKKQKIARFESRLCLNDKVEGPMIHMSLNFSPADKIDQKLFKQIAAAYLKAMGFKHQPYLLYEHLDAGHPHAHLLTTSIKRDGSAINIHIRESIKISAQLDEYFKLTKPVPFDERPHFLPGDPVFKPSYGKQPTATLISSAVYYVLKTYKITSLNELNAILGLYHVQAVRGKSNSHLYKFKGLIYGFLKENGKRQGKPIKASDLPTKPTLKNLRVRFKINAVERQKFIRPLRNEIDLALLNPGTTLTDMKSSLESKGIRMIPIYDQNNHFETIIYVDHRSQCAFDQNVLGSDYTINALSRRLTSKQIHGHSLVTTESNLKKLVSLNSDFSDFRPNLIEQQDKQIRDLFHPVASPSQLPLREGNSFAKTAKIKL